MATNDEEPLFRTAAMQWPKRWNKMSKKTPVAAVTQVGESTMLTTCLGWVMFDREDGPHLLRQLEAAVDILRKEIDQ